MIPFIKSSTGIKDNYELTMILTDNVELELTVLDIINFTKWNIIIDYITDDYWGPKTIFAALKEWLLTGSFHFTVTFLSVGIIYIKGTEYSTPITTIIQLYSVPDNDIRRVRSRIALLEKELTELRALSEMIE